MAEVTFDKAEALKLLELMIETNTVNPPGNELVLAKKLKELAEKEGLEAELDEFLPNRANLVVRLKGKKSTAELVTTGHLDTVPVGETAWDHDPFRLTVEGDTAYGRGISDMKSGDAAMLFAMFLLKRNGIVPEQDTIFVGTVGEETMDLGSGHFVEKGGMDNAGALLVCEPSGLDIYRCHKGAAWVKLRFYGKISHGSMPDLGVNAVMHMAKFLDCLSKQDFDCELDKYLGMPTFSVNQCTGGAAPNVVPDYAECVIDFRTIPGQTWDDVKVFLDRALNAAAEGEEDFRYDYEYMDKFLSPVACPEGHHILTDLDKAAGRELKRSQVNFFTDASTMVTSDALPVVIFGPGESAQAHQRNEHMSISKYYEAVSIYYNFVKEYIAD